MRTTRPSRFQRDAADFQRAILRLKRKNFHPYALKMYRLGPGEHDTYKFSSVSINPSLLAKFKEILFAAPKVPSGWRLIVELPRTARVPVPRRQASPPASPHPKDPRGFPPSRPSPRR